jgi:hypothetical protein
MVGLPESLHLREGPRFIFLVFDVLQPDEAVDDPRCDGNEETKRPSISPQPRHQACRPATRWQSYRHSGYEADGAFSVGQPDTKKLMIPLNESMSHFLQTIDLTDMA